MARPRPQQDRVADALEQAKTQETVGGLDPATQQMWDSFTDEERWRVLQLPNADRSTEIQRYHAKKQETYQTNPFLSQLQAERSGGNQPSLTDRPAVKRRMAASNKNWVDEARAKAAAERARRDHIAASTGATGGREAAREAGIERLYGDRQGLSLSDTAAQMRIRQEAEALRQRGERQGLAAPAVSIEEYKAKGLLLEPDPRGTE
jgi:hypothetical protein